MRPRPLAWILCLLFSSASSWSAAEGEPSHYQAKTFKRRIQKIQSSLPTLQFFNICDFIFHFLNILPRCNNGCTLQGDNKQRLWEGCQWLPITPWGPKEWYWCYFPSAVLIERGLAHTINSKMIFKISRVTKTYICQTWILYITQAPCMFDTRMKVFQDMESIIDNWSNCHPTFEEADSCTYSMIVSKPSKPYVGLRGWVRWCFFSQYTYKNISAHIFL